MKRNIFRRNKPKTDLPTFNPELIMELGKNVYPADHPFYELTELTLAGAQAQKIEKVLQDSDLSLFFEAYEQDYVKAVISLVWILKKTLTQKGIPFEKYFDYAILDQMISESNEYDTITVKNEFGDKSLYITIDPIDSTITFHDPKNLINKNDLKSDDENYELYRDLSISLRRLKVFCEQVGIEYITAIDSMK